MKPITVKDVHIVALAIYLQQPSFYAPLSSQQITYLPPIAKDIAVAVYLLSPDLTNKISVKERTKLINKYADLIKAGKIDELSLESGIPAERLNQLLGYLVATIQPCESSEEDWSSFIAQMKAGLTNAKSNQDS
jgi:predicted molibdopterin-dependent oxidoreductase YjgC